MFISPLNFHLKSILASISPSHPGKVYPQNASPADSPPLTQRLPSWMDQLPSRKRVDALPGGNDGRSHEKLHQNWRLFVNWDRQRVSTPQISMHFPSEHFKNLSASSLIKCWSPNSALFLNNCHRLPNIGTCSQLSPIIFTGHALML